MAILSEVTSRWLLFALVALWVLDQCSPLQEDVFVLVNKDRPVKKTIVIVTRTDDDSVAVDCVTLTDEMVVEKIVTSTAAYVLMKLPVKTIQSVSKECDTLSKRHKRRESNLNDTQTEDCIDNDCGDPGNQTDGEKMWSIIFPGTKYCGSGAIATDYDDLGILEDTDRCCRSHDYCNDYIIAGETKHNLTNNSMFTALSCECDEAFYDCLSNVSSLVSNSIGNTYFNLLQKSCFYEDYPFSTTCKTYSFLHLTCIEYERNTTLPKVYMWRSAKSYDKLPLPVVG